MTAPDPREVVTVWLSPFDFQVAQDHAYPDEVPYHIYTVEQDAARERAVEAGRVLMEEMPVGVLVDAMKQASKRGEQRIPVYASEECVAALAALRTALRGVDGKEGT